MTRQAYGSGSMSEREPGVWRLRVVIDGKQRQETLRGTEAAARKHLRSMDPGEQPFDDSPTADGHAFGELLTKWLVHIEARGRAPKTIDENRREIEARIRPALGGVAVADLTAEDLDGAYTTWLAEGLSPSSVHRHAAVISAALTQGVKWGWLDTSPAAKASPPSAAVGRKIVTPTVEQVAKLIRTAQSDDPVMAAAVALAFVTGARRGELAALRWSHIDLEAGTVRIERSLTQVGDNLTEKGTKTGRDRRVAIDVRTVGLLEHHSAWQADLSRRAESPLVVDPYVLSDNANGARPMMPSKITDRFTSLRAKAGVRGVRFHDLRHANVSEQLAAGVDPATVAARAGHASTRMTLDRYAHALPAGGVAAGAVMGALLPTE
jgi:integrase